MLMLRRGGKFTDSRIERHIWSGIIYIVLGVIVFIVVSSFLSMTIGMIAGAGIASQAVTSFKESGNWSRGKEGELAVAEALKDLADEYVLLNDLVLPGGKGNIDHVVMGPNGLFVVETKNYSTYVRCVGDDWFVGRKRISSLSKQAKRNAVALRENLAAVFQDQRTRLPYVVPLLVFVGGSCRLSLRDPTIHVLRSSELSRFVARYNSAKAPSITSPELRRTIVHHLHLLQPNPDKLAVNS